MRSTRSMLGLLVSFSLWHFTLAASATTSAPAPANTSCPLFLPRYRPDAQYAATGHLTRPATPLAKLCLDQSNNDCYLKCGKNPLCVSYSEDYYQKTCVLYDKTLASMGFVKSNDTQIYFTEPRLCYICNAPPPKKRPGCSTDQPVRIQPPLKNYTCGATGIFPDDTRVTGRPGLTFEQCYGLCASYDEMEACSSFGFRPDGGRFGTSCSIYLRSLQQKGFKYSNQSNLQGWSLRGCFECNLPETSTCVPTPIPVNPKFNNSDFSETFFNTKNNITQPKYWVRGGQNTTTTVTGPGGNKYARLFATSANGGRDRSTSILQSLSGFDLDPSSPGRFYNLSYDLALVQYYKPKKATEGCTLDLPFNNQPVKLFNWTVSPKFFTIGPKLLDASSLFKAEDGNPLVTFSLNCYESLNNVYIAGNATVLVDNVKWTQNGRVIGGS